MAKKGAAKKTKASTSNKADGKKKNKLIEGTPSTTILYYLL
jgi:hypothetical protein